MGMWQQLTVPLLDLVEHRSQGRCAHQVPRCAVEQQVGACDGAGLHSTTHTHSYTAAIFVVPYLAPYDCHYTVW